MVYTDFTKAYDSCDDSVIDNKMRSTSKAEKVGKRIFKFLSLNTKDVVTKRESSRGKVKTFVPHGMGLAPFLFLSLLANIDKTSGHSFMSYFAKDAKTSMEVAAVEDTEKFQPVFNRTF